MMITSIMKYIFLSDCSEHGSGQLLCVGSEPGPGMTGSVLAIGKPEKSDIILGLWYIMDSQISETGGPAVIEEPAIKAFRSIIVTEKGMGVVMEKDMKDVHMKLVVIVLNKVECLQELLEEFAERKLQGATVINSHGMMQELSEEDEMRFILSLRHILNPEHKENRTIFMAASESKVPVIIDAVNKITGGLDKGDTGILFTLPIDYLEGFRIHD